jgi:preprotein translocase subunit SecA
MSSATAKFWADAGDLAPGPYAERSDAKSNWLDRALRASIGGAVSRATPRRLWARGLADRVEAIGKDLQALTPAELRARVEVLRPHLLREGYTGRNVAEAFALVREVSRREIGMSHRPVQIYGGYLLLRGSLLEMATGEGKTLTAVLAAATAALAGLPVHVVTVNDYLAQRDFEELSPVYRALGLTAGLVINGMEPPARAAAYRSSIVYVNNKEITFDYLRDRMTLGLRRSTARARIISAFGSPESNAARQGELILRGLHFAIVDEADSVLIDEARTPLIISSQGAGSANTADFRLALDMAQRLVPGEDFEISRSELSPQLKSAARRKLKKMAEGLGGLWQVRRARDDRVTQALSALYVFERDKHYIVADDKVQIVDEYTGRVMEDRSWEAGLHQMIETKEGVTLTGQRSTIARITYQRFFRRYRRLSGMTGTGVEISGELLAEFDIRTVKVPTHRPVLRRNRGTRIFKAAERKWETVVTAIAAVARGPGDTATPSGRPVLVGVRSVEDSDRLSAMLQAAGLEHVVLNARQDADEAEAIARAGQRGAVTVATNMAGRGTDIKLGPGVADLGGLHVILTEFHESARIDRQLFGRAGRQGDPGSCEAIVALDDELFRRFAPGLRRAFERLRPRPDGSLPPRTARLLRSVAQARAEWLHAGTRRIQVKLDKDLAKALAFSGKPE